MTTSQHVDQVALDQMVEDFTRNFRPRARAEMDVFRRQSLIEVAIQRAALCLGSNGKRHPHQRRIPEGVLRAANSRLQHARKAIRAATDFDALHAIVQDQIGHITGVGDLTIYDIAHRIGAFLRKEPKRVYLHSGAADGARLLGFGGSTVDPKELPRALSRLTPAEIEDFLCIYKSRLAGQSRARLMSKCFIPEDDFD
jgi:hypothetical protein